MSGFDAKYYINEGIDKTNQGDYISALENFDKAIEIDPSRPLIYFSKAIVFHNLHRLEEAYENYTKAIELDEKMTDAYYNRAQILLLSENISDETYKRALLDLEKSLNLDNKFIDALYYAAVVKMKLKDYQGAVDYLDRVLEIEPAAIHSRALKKLILQKYMK